MEVPYCDCFTTLIFYMLVPDLISVILFSTNVLLGSIFLHIWQRFLHHTHAICGEFQISPHLSCGDIWNFSTCGEIFNFPTIVIHGKLKFLHMTIFSPLMILVILVTNMRSVGDAKGTVLLTSWGRSLLSEQINWGSLFGDHIVLSCNHPNTINTGEH